MQKIGPLRARLQKGLSAAASVTAAIEALTSALAVGLAPVMWASCIW